MTAATPEPTPNETVAERRRVMHEHYGMTVIAGMVLEKALWALLMAVENSPFKKTANPDKDIQAMINKHRSWTFGQLLRELKKKTKFPEGLEASLDDAVGNRNYLVHHFILDNSALLKSTDGLAIIDVELKRHYDSFVALNRRCDAITEEILRDALEERAKDDAQ
jgi:hypothetical protein